MNKSLIVAKFLAFIYYSECGFEGFYIGHTADPSIFFSDEDIIISTDNFKIVKAETRDTAIAVIDYFKGLGCEGGSVQAEIDKDYVYVCLKIVQTVS